MSTVVTELAERRQGRWRVPALVWAMMIAVAFIAALANWDQAREATVALEDFAGGQAVAARILAVQLEDKIRTSRRDVRIAAEFLATGDRLPASLTERYQEFQLRSDGPSWSGSRTSSQGMVLATPVAGKGHVRLVLPMRSLFEGLTSAERRGSTLVLLRPPGDTALRTADGRSLHAEGLLKGLDEGLSSHRLGPKEAAELGLPQRTAIAGLARAGASPTEEWGVVVVASAERERDREFRARNRILLAVLTSGGLVLGFGGLALYRQRKELELSRELVVAELERRRDERLERLDKAATLGTIAMGISHEISTPLGVIAGRAELLVPRLSGDERASHAVQVILDQSQRISEIIRAFLSLARGDRALVVPIAPRKIIEAARGLVEHRFAKARVGLSLELQEQLQDLHGDPLLLEHALVNLLLNACEACKDGGSVILSARNGGGAIRFEVIDDGSGISLEAAARATEPFFTTKAMAGGTGLGLAIVNEIVMHHGGRLTISPGTTRGTQAQMDIPIHRGGQA